MSSVRVLIVALLALVVTFSGALAQANPPPKSPFGTPGVARTAPAAQQVAEPQGVLGQTWLALVKAQRDLTEAMTTAVRRLKTGDFVSSTMFLAFVSFMYGVLHAVGPGHGKFVISSYALANEQTVRRGIVLSFMAALVQALSAIALVSVAIMVFRATSVEMRQVEAWLELVSWGLIAGLGMWMLWRQVGPLLAGRGAAAAAGAGHHHHDHAHGHDHAHHDKSHHGHGHGVAVATVADDHVHDEHCGHMHVPPPSALQGAWSWREAWALALSIGVRPCTGAILVLIFASSIGLFWAGVFATFAMAVGTAITISALAAIAVSSRNLAARVAGADSLWGNRIVVGAGIAGALLVTLLGAAGFIAALGGPGPL